MPNYKSVLVEVDAASWAPAAAPAQLLNAAAAGPFTVDLDAALLFIGLWTRPPTRRGFTLADCWAWLRYFPAFSPGHALQLCEEWSNVDPHQKTVASDELGVGLTTWILHRTLDFQRYSDTTWVVNVLDPGNWDYLSRARRGPGKSPDYIAEDSAGGLSVLECKGTQTSLAELRRAIDRGRPQKENVVPRGGGALIHSLVAGAFVPQASTQERATVRVVDPEWKPLTEELRKFSADDIRASTEQVAYAKELSVFDLTETAAALVRAKDHLTPAVALSRDLEARHSTVSRLDDSIEVVREHYWPTPVARGDDMLVGVRFRGILELDRLDPVRRPTAQLDPRESISEATSKMSWREHSRDQGVRFISPIGATYEVEWLARS